VRRRTLCTQKKEVLAAEAAGQVTIVKTNIVVNCTVIFTPQGGLLPTAKMSGNGSVQLPLVSAWYKGQAGYYIQTEASDQQVAKQQGVNFVPLLARAIDAKAVDYIYVFTNFKQANVIPSAPMPAGPGNKDPNYSPLWHVSTVTWNQSATPYTLRSEEEVLAAAATGQVTIVKTNIVVNCPVIFTPQGGMLPTAMISP
jgi:hypothetical protein